MCSEEIFQVVVLYNRSLFVVSVGYEFEGEDILVTESKCVRVSVPAIGLYRERAVPLIPAQIPKREHELHENVVCTRR
jgi:hypothetical protein